MPLADCCHVMGPTPGVGTAKGIPPGGGVIASIGVLAPDARLLAVQLLNRLAVGLRIGLTDEGRQVALLTESVAAPGLRLHLPRLHLAQLVGHLRLLLSHVLLELLHLLLLLDDVLNLLVDLVLLLLDLLLQLLNLVLLLGLGLLLLELVERGGGGVSAEALRRTDIL